MSQVNTEELGPVSKALDFSNNVFNKFAYKIVNPGEWKARYIAYMLGEGLSLEDANYYFDGIKFGTAQAVYDCSDNPEEAAEEDLTYG
jgi:hypothetical protein